METCPRTLGSISSGGWIAISAISGICIGVLLTLFYQRLRSRGTHNSNGVGASQQVSIDKFRSSASLNGSICHMWFLCLLLARQSFAVFEITPQLAA